MIKCRSEKVERDFSGDPVVKISHASAGLVPGQGARISCASWSKHQNVKWEQCGNKFANNFKMVHIFKNRSYLVKNEKVKWRLMKKVNIPSVWETLTWKTTIHFPCLLSRNICDDSHCDWCWRSKRPKRDVEVQNPVPGAKHPFAQHVYNQQWDWGHYHGGSRTWQRSKPTEICIWICL